MTTRVPPELVLVGRRLAILAVLRKRPGLGLRELARATAIPMGTMNHHLNVLIRHDEAWCTYHGPKRRIFAGRKPDEATALAAARKAGLDAAMRTLLAYIEEHPLACQVDLFQAFPDRPRSTVQHVLARLEREGFLRRASYGRYIRYDAVSQAKAARRLPLAARSSLPGVAS